MRYSINRQAQHLLPILQDWRVGRRGNFWKGLAQAMGISPAKEEKATGAHAQSNIIRALKTHILHGFITSQVERITVNF